MTRQQLQQTRTGYITSDIAYDDYEFKANDPMKVHAGDGYVCIGKSIRIDIPEIRDDVLPHLTWLETK